MLNSVSTFYAHLTQNPGSPEDSFNVYFITNLLISLLLLAYFRLGKPVHKQEITSCLVKNKIGTLHLILNHFSTIQTRRKIS